ncbi:hypothetical protein BD410DRAFT_809112 [Rickenella mellea]|uniref:JmjC domain-containing protein n=1 Tax=Rickenella mellea TaxID=50990 RepID=A0A4Y7PK49_9AGAM|nr:hypothetical protein BD410DRAFT_809112 [Rickenella mellea]
MTPEPGPSSIETSGLTAYKTSIDEVNQQAIALYRLTPLSLSSTWYASTEAWHALQAAWPSTDSQPAIPGFISLLYRNTVRFDNKLKSDIHRSDGCPFGRAAFREIGDKEQSCHQNNYLHGLLQGSLLDRVLWMNENVRVGNLAVPRQIPHTTLRKPDDNVTRWRKYTHDEWTSTIRDFIHAWKESSPGPNRTTEAPNADNPDASYVCSSLFQAISAAAKNRHFCTAETNICTAALALRALVQLSGEDLDENTKDERWAARFLKSIKIEVQDRNGSPTQTLNDKLTNNDFMRPLYAAVAFSPVVLLGNSTLSPLGRNKIPLTSLSQWDQDRLKIEHDCWMIVVRAAVIGASAIRTSLAEMVPQWESLGFMTDQLYPQCTVTSNDVWDEQFAATLSLNSVASRISKDMAARAMARPRKTQQETQIHEGGGTVAQWFDRIVHDIAHPASPTVENRSAGMSSLVPKSATTTTTPPPNEPRRSDRTRTPAQPDKTIPIYTSAGTSFKPSHKRRTHTQASKSTASKKLRLEPPDDAVLVPLKAPVYDADLIPPALEPIKVAQNKLPDITFELDTAKVQGTHVEWSTQDFRISRWEGMVIAQKLEFAMTALETVLQRTVPSRNVGRTPGSVLTIGRSEWINLSRSQRGCFANQHVHVIGSPTDEVLPGVTSLDSPSLEEYMDLQDMRFVHVLSMNHENQPSNDDLHRATIQSFIDDLKEPEKKCVVNYLDIDLSASSMRLPLHHLKDGHNLISRNEPRFAWASPWPYPAFAWGLVASESAISLSHMDAGSLATIIHIITGAKLWFIAINCDDVTPTSDGWDDTQYQWQALLLNPGDDLYMRPGTPHFVVTTKDCLAVGGHFYSAVCFSRSLRAITLEHFFGTMITNTEHPKAPIVLCKLFSFYLSLLETRPNSHLAGKLPSQHELACLVIFLGHLDQLAPNAPTDSPFVSRWQETAEFARDFANLTLLLNDFRAIVMQKDSFGIEFLIALRPAEAQYNDLLVQCRNGLSKKGQQTIDVKFVPFIVDDEYPSQQQI